MFDYCHCEEQSDEAIQLIDWIASLASGWFIPAKAGTRNDVKIT